MDQGPTFQISVPNDPTQDPHHRILARQRSRFTHHYFYIRDEVLGPIIVRVASFFPLHATYWLNGHSFIERELKRAGVGFHKNKKVAPKVKTIFCLRLVKDRQVSLVLGSMGASRHLHSFSPASLLVSPRNVDHAR